RPVVTDDRRHLAVIADDDETAVGPQRQGRHDGLRDRHLRRLVENDAVDEVMAEEILLHHVVDAARRGGDDAPGLPDDRVDDLTLLHLAAEWRNAVIDLPAWSLAEERHVDETAVEKARHHLRVLREETMQRLLRIADIAEQDVGRRVCLAAQEDATGPAGGHRTLDPGEERVRCREALAGPWRPLDDKDGIIAV